MSSGQDGGVSLEDLVSAVWRRRFVALAVTAFIAALTGAVVMSLTPRYTASALLLLSSKPTAELEDGGAKVIAATDPFAVRSEVEILTSDELCLHVIEDLKLADTSEFASSAGSSGSALDGLRKWLGLGPRGGESTLLTSQEEARGRLLAAYQDRLGVFNDGRSLTVQVSFTAHDPRLASLVADAHVKAYLAAQAERRMASQRLAAEWLHKELTTRAAELSTAENASQAFLASNGLVLSQHGAQSSSAVDEELRQISAQLTNAKADVVRATARLQQIDARPADDLVSGTTDIVDTPIMTMLRQKESEARLRVNLLSMQGSVPTGVNQSLQAAQTALESIQATIRTEMRRLRGSLASDVNAATTQVKLLDAELSNAQERKVGYDQAEIQLHALDSIVAAKRAVYEAVLNRYNVIISQQNFSAPDASLISAAEVPTKQSFPKPAILMTIGFSIASIFGVGSAYTLERLRPSSRGIDTVTESIALRGLVNIPLPRTYNIDARLEGHLIVERIRRLRTLVLGFPGDRCTVITLTSAVPGEGKTFVSANLARSAASADVDTLLIDGDLRRSQAARALGLRDAPVLGLVDLLKSKATLEQAIVRIGNSSLYLLAPGSGSSMDHDSLASGRLQELLLDLRSRFKVIVIDTPPLEAVVDALLFSKLADQTVFISHSEKAPASAVHRAHDQLRSNGVEVSAVVQTGPTGYDEMVLTKLGLDDYYASASPDERPSTAVTPPPRASLPKRSWPDKSVA